MHRIICFFICFLSISTYSGNNPLPPDLSTINANDLDYRLPQMSLERWLKSNLSQITGVQITPELTGCGEITGSPDQKEYPICIEIALVNDTGTDYLYIGVGDSERGISGPPDFYWGLVDNRTIYELSELFPPKPEPKLSFEPDIPYNIRSALVSESCTPIKAINNLRETHTAAVTGKFSRQSDNDWAFLCEGEKPKLLVVSEGEFGCLRSFHISGDFLSAVTPEWMLERIQRYTPKNEYPDLQHQGLSVGIHMTSIVFYCHNSQWIQLPGSD